MSKIGAHVSGNPRHNYRRLCQAKPAVILSLNDGGALYEAKELSGGHTLTIFRDTSVYKDGPGDINHPPGTYKQMAEYWYPKLKEKWVLNPADYYTITIELGGGGDDVASYRNLVAYEREVMKLANEDGLRVCILNLASGSPDPIDVWIVELVPFIKEAFEAGNIYGRHVYDGGYDRAFQEAQWLIDNDLGYGGIAITEWGFDGGYGQVHTVQGIATQDEAYWDYSNIIGFCVWELGDTEFGANWDSLIPEVATWMDAHPTPKWEPGEPPPSQSLEEFLWDVSVGEQIERGIPLNPNAGLQQAIFSAHRTPVHRERTPTYPGDGKAYTIQAGEDVEGVLPRKVYVWQPGVPIWSFPNPRLVADPLPGFRIGAPFQVPFVLTSPYGVLRDYDGDGVYDDLHEGADYDIIGGPADSKEPVICGVNGVVKRSIASTGAYGNYVIVGTSYNGYAIDIWYCHMDARYVNQGDAVSKGTYLGELGGTGGEWAEHVHINMQVEGLGNNDPRYVIPNTLDPHKYMDMTPAVPNKVDLAAFFFPSAGNYGDIVILQNNWGQGDERQQLQRDGNVSYVTKNAEWEKRLITPSYIDLVKDTSRGGGEFYTVEGHWLPRYMTPGKAFARVETVTVYTFSCQLVSRYTQPSDIVFAEHYNSLTINGITVRDVGRFLWKLNGATEEEYYYARGLGLVEWKNRSGFHSYIRELIPVGSQSNNVRRPDPC